jgi:ketosteroid isomerase-like protein
MYHTIVKNKLTAAFDGLNAGNIQAVLKELSDKPEHFFIGEHALGGTRHTKASIEQWYQRLLQIFPDIHFTLNEIQVSGSPWNTVGLVYWTETNSGTDGVRTQNTGLNVIRIRWGKVVSIRIYTDTNILLKTLDRLARAGNQAAKAAPIVS